MASKTNEIIIGTLAIVSIILVAIESLVSVSNNVLIGIYIFDVVICIVFAWDFVQRIRSSENISRFMKTNSYEILAMIPAVSLYALGTIPAISVALRSLRFVRVVRVIFLAARLRRAMSKTGRFLQQSHLLAMLGITISIIFIGAFAAFLLEGGSQGAQINNFSDAIWWAISTVTTVGYGDIVPHTIAGRIMGMGLMVIGIGIMAAFISQVSATLVESRFKQNAMKGDLRSNIITEIKSRIDRVDKLSEKEMSVLIQMIQTLRLEDHKT
jgi:voltage-gated potassium channel